MRILLVDGDDGQLRERRKSLWARHRDWEVLLAGTGAQALEALARDPVDILLADAVLPDITGAELMQRVRAACPAVVRLVLMEAPGPEPGDLEGQAHRVLLKPLELPLLAEVLESLQGEDDAETQRQVRRFVGGLVRIPSLPGLYSELVALLEREGAGMGEVARLVRKDLGVASLVLKLANSVHSATERPVSELGQALARLGLDSLRALVLFRGLLSGAETHPQGLDLERLWLHSFEVATGVRKLATLEGETQLADLAFSVGLLHDLGLVVLAMDPSTGYRAVLERAQSSRLPISVLEHEAYGLDHAQVGAYLLGLWGLPAAFRKPVREHHAPPQPAGGFPLSLALHLADARHGGGRSAGLFADGRWGLHPHVMADGERFTRWKACLAMDNPHG